MYTLVALLFGVALGAQIPGYNELLFGFDAVRGIPLAEIAPITYTKGKTWSHPLRPTVTFEVPDQFQVHEDAVEDIYDSYEETLDKWVETKALSLGLKFGYLGFVGLSTEYDHVKEKFITQERSFHERKELLGYYQLSPVPGSFSTSKIVDAAALLPATCENPDDLNKYVAFVKAYGTHYITFVRMGGLMHQTTEFSADTLETVDRHVIDDEISGAWDGFTAGASVGHEFENDQYKQTNHTTVHFTINGGNIYKKYADQQDWKNTIPENPAVIQRSLSPVSDLLNPSLSRCIDAGTRTYYASAISPGALVSHEFETTTNTWTQSDLQVLKGYMMTGVTCEFGSTCSDFCKNDGPMVRAITMTGRSFYGPYVSHDPKNCTVKGKIPSAEHAVEYMCPENTYLAGMKLSWASTCSKKCAQDGPVLAGIDLVCRTPQKITSFRLLSDPSPSQVPARKVIPIEAAAGSQSYGECPEDYLAESLTVRTAGTCLHKCDKDGAAIAEIALNCRALSDFIF